MRAVMLGLAILLIPAFSQLPAAEVEAGVTITFNDAALSEVILALEEAAGRRIIVTPAVRTDETITTSNVMRSKSLDAMLNKILTPRGYTWSYGSPVTLASVGIAGRPLIVVDSVVPGSVADRAGVRSGDLIRSINRFKVSSRIEASDLLAKFPEPRVEILRPGIEATIELTLNSNY
jgi:S1-C subfamily serine protease